MRGLEGRWATLVTLLAVACQRDALSPPAAPADMTTLSGCESPPPPCEHQDLKFFHDAQNCAEVGTECSLGTLICWCDGRTLWCNPCACSPGPTESGSPPRAPCAGGAVLCSFGAEQSCDCRDASGHWRCRGGLAPSDFSLPRDGG